MRIFHPINESWVERLEHTCEMPVNVAMDEPRTRVIGQEANDRDIGGVLPNVHNVTSNRIVVVVFRTSSTLDDGEGMLNGTQ